MTASMSASYHMLSAPDAPAPMAMERMAMTARSGLQRDGSGDQADKGREDDERHDAGLQELQVIARRRLREAGVVETGLVQKRHATLL